MKALAASTLMGDGMQPGIARGPIQNRMQFDQMVALVDRARAQGASIVCGGEAHGGPGHFDPLTLVTDIADAAALVDEEQFGPVLPVVRHSDVEAAIARAHRLDAELGASVWSTNVERAKAVASRIQAGTVTCITATSGPSCAAPLRRDAVDEQREWMTRVGVRWDRAAVRPASTVVSRTVSQ